jgi:hypothetical protein
MEDKLQANIVQWFNNEFCLTHHPNRCLIFAVPNGGHRNVAEALKLQATGTLKGVSDLIVCIGKNTIFVELKFGNNNQTAAQKEFQKRVENLGFEYWLIYDVDDFKQKAQNKYERLHLW